MIQAQKWIWHIYTMLTFSRCDPCKVIEASTSFAKGQNVMQALGMHPHERTLTGCIMNEWPHHHHPYL